MIDILKFNSDGVIIKIKVVPNSSKNEFVREDEFIKLKITAPPVENKANKFVISYLSKCFKIPKTSIEIMKGETSKVKTILLKTSDIDKRNSIEEYFS